MDGPSANNSFMAEVSYQFIKWAGYEKAVTIPKDCEVGLNGFSYRQQNKHLATRLAYSKE